MGWPLSLLRMPFFFLWVTPAVLSGWRRTLEQSDARNTSGWTSASTESLLRWYDATPGSFKPKLWRLLRLRLALSGGLYAVYCATQLVQPLLLRRVVLAVEASAPEGAWYALAIGCAGVLGSMAKEQQLFINYSLGSELRSLVVALVYREALRLREADAPPTIANLLTNDAQKLLEALPLIHLLWATPTMILAAAVMLVELAGWAALSGMALLVCLIPANLYLVRQLKAARAAHLPLADTRVSRCVELVRAVRALKFNGWDAEFERGIIELRERELPYVRTELRLFSYLMTMTVALPQLATALALAAAVLARPDLPLTADLAFPALSLFSVTRFPIMFFGELSGQLAQASVALRRLTRFLDNAAATAGAGEDAPTPQLAVRAVGTAGVRLQVEGEGGQARQAAALPAEPELPAKGQPLLLVEEASFSWRRKDAVLALAGKRDARASSGDTALSVSRVSLSLEPGQLLLVVGAVGSGKSSLLAGVLGEAVREGGRVDAACARRRVAYCAQGAWVQNMSVRDNVLFGREMDAEWYARVLRGCALEADLAVLSHGDGTIIGERGVTLSGGQKQRVALARAVYSRPSLVLLDDVFSALDGPTGHAIFDALFGEADGLLSGAAVVLVGHATQFAPRATAGCLVMHGGRAIARGTVAQLRETRANEEAAAGAGRASSLAVDELHALAAFLDSFGDTDDILASAEECEDGEAMSEAREGEGQGGVLATKSAAAAPLKAGAADDFAREVTAKEARLGVRTMASWVITAGGCFWLIIELCFFLCERLSYVGADYWLSSWTSAAPDAVAADAGAGRYSNARALGELLGFGPVEDAGDTRRYLLVYSVLILCNALFALLRTSWFVRGGWRAAKRIFESLLHAIARSPMSFFDTTPVGRITARLAYDTEIIDGLFVQKALTVMASFFWLLSGLTVVLSVVPIVAIAMVPCAIVYSIVHMMYVRAGVQMQRLYAQSVSPLVSHIEESLAGGATVRAFGETERFRARLSSLNDDAAMAFTSFIGVGRWLALRLETIGALVSFSVTLACWALSDSLSGPLAGLAVMWSFNLTITLNFLVLSTSELEAKGVSLERALEYTALPSEAERHLPPDEALMESKWPTAGELRFENVTLRYRASLPPALNGFDVAIAPGEHVGIVGRTGAGKSTIASALFRLVELEAGRITLDGVDLRTLGLQQLRGSRALAIVTQDPVLFRGALRRSLDPLDAYGDGELWGALAAVGMEAAVRALPEELEAPSDEGGSNWSVGERQLLCFARATLRRPRVLLLDEATASIDHAADQRIQRAIRSAMAEVTLLTIAHRLHTVIDYQRIVVMDTGRCVEAAPPHVLLTDPGSALSTLVDAMGASTAATLRELAADAYPSTKRQGR